MIAKHLKILVLSALAIPIFTSAQKISVTGKVTGKAAQLVKEIQFIRDGKMQRLLVNKEDGSFSGDIKLQAPQFVEIKSGNNQAQFYYLLPNEKMNLVIEKPNLPESNVTIENPKLVLLQKIVDSYFNALQKKGINTKSRDWQLLLFNNNESLTYAEAALKLQLQKNSSFLTALPGFKKDMALFMRIFRNYTVIDTMSLTDIEAALRDLRKENLKHSAINIPFFREYLTDLTNAYAARLLEKYGLSLDFMKQRHIPQFIAAEAIREYVADSSIRSYMFSEKLRMELPVNGLKNEAFINFLLEHSSAFVKEAYRERIETLQANKLPDMNSPRKKAFNFLLHDSTGKVYRLDDFKGKMVFVDFWASWCAPCKAQIPYQKELEKKYQGKDIVFLSVSLDRSKEAWLKAVKEEDLHGYILHAEGDFKNDFPRAYTVESIPRYLLIDADGNIISDNMIKPQNKKEISGIFDEELYAKNTNEILEKHFKAIGAEELKRHGLVFDYRQTIPGFASQNTVYYSYPSRMKSTISFEPNEQMILMLGDDFFTEKIVVMDGEKLTTNFPEMAGIKDTWVSKIMGFELYLRHTVNNAVVKFSEENSAGADSSYVLKLYYKGVLEKYYINKKTYLIDKIVLEQQNTPRKGGGIFEATTSYDDYRPVGGIMLPFKVNQSNIITIKVEKAELKPIDPSVFTMEIK